MTRIASAVLFLAIASQAQYARAFDILPGVEKNVLIHFGLRGLDQEEWAPLENQGVFGVELDFRPQDWPVSFLVGLMVSSDKRSEVVVADSVPISADFEASMFELDAGFRKYFNLFGGLSLYLDLGVNVFSADVTVGSQWSGNETSSDSNVGFFYGGGINAGLGVFNLGLNARMMSGGKLGLFGDDLKSDYFQAALVLGWSY